VHARLIDYNFLADARDRRRTLEYVKISRQIGRDDAFAAVAETELAPGPDVRSNAALETAIWEQLDTYQHATSTVPMGPEGDEGAIVDTFGAVHGIEQLRVIDASIMPNIPSAPTNLTTIMWPSTSTKGRLPSEQLDRRRVCPEFAYLYLYLIISPSGWLLPKCRDLVSPGNLYDCQMILSK